MTLFPEEIRKQLPPLYSQEHEQDPIVSAKFFHPNSHWTWYAIEFYPNHGMFFGWVYGDYPELGYFSLTELEEVKDQLGIGVERDAHFTPMRLSEVKKLQPDRYPRNWRELAIACKERANWQCQEGGVTQETGRISQRTGAIYCVFLHAAHTQLHDTNNPQPELQALCPSCHGRRDWQLR